MMHATRQPVYRTLDQIQALVEAFEQCTLPPQQFNHHAHMTVALWYLTRLPYAEAVSQVRSGIQRFAAANHHDNLYNETITLFWLRLLRHYLDVAQPDQALPDLVYHALEKLGSMHFVYSHYSREHVFSEEARRQWVDPDLLPLTI